MNHHVNASSRRCSLPKAGRGDKVTARVAWHRRQVGVIKLFGTIKIEPVFDHKMERAKR